MKLERYNSFSKLNEEGHESPRKPKTEFGLDKNYRTKNYEKVNIIEDVANKYGLNEILYELQKFYEKGGERKSAELVSKWLEEYEEMAGVGILENKKKNDNNYLEFINESKVTKKAIREYLKHMLGTNEKWAIKALIKIYNNQTEDEINVQATTEYNNIGFTGVDGQILTSFSKQYLKRGFLTPKQMTILMKKMPKYWKQILEISDKEKLDSQVQKWINKNA